MIKFPCFMVYDESLMDQGYSWQCCSLYEYLQFKISGVKKVRIDWYSQPIPRRKNQ